MNRRRLAVFLLAALTAVMHVATGHPQAVAATVVTPGTISTYAGGAGSGLATKLPQTPVGLALSGTTLYVSAWLTSGGAGVVRAVDLTTGIETLVAGTGSAYSSGDGGPAVDAGINIPQGLAVDAGGNLYIATVDRIRKVTPSGIISTVAGGGTGALGDGGPATSATLAAIGVAVDSSGDLFIADSGHNRVRKVNHVTGHITTIAGNGTAGFGGDGAAATAAELDSPSGVAVDGSGNVWIADTQNGRIREVSAGVISTVAGNGVTYPVCQVAGTPATAFNLGRPIGLSIDAGGNLYITADRCVQKLSGSTLTIVAGCDACSYQGDGQPPLSTALYAPQDAVVNATGDLFIAMAGGMRVQEAPAGGANMITVAGTGGTCAQNTSGLATDAYLCDVRGLATDAAGNLFIAERSGNVVEEVTPGGAISTFAGNGVPGYSGDGGSATAAQLYSPLALAVDGSGNLFIADATNGRIRKVSGGVITTLASNIFAEALAIDGAGNVLAADYEGQRVYRITPGGTVSTVAGTGTPGFSGDGGPATSAELFDPAAIGVDSAGNIFIADMLNQRVRKVDAGGTISTFARLPSPPNGVSLDGQMAVGPGDQVVVGTTFNGQNVEMVTSAGNVVVAGTGVSGFSGDGGLAKAANLQEPDGVAFDASGDLYIADNGNHRIRRVQTYGATASPTKVSASAGYASVRVQWKAPTNNTGLSVIDYRVTPYVGLTPGTPIHVTGIPAPTSVVIPGLAASTQYTFKVSASNGWLSSPDSSASPPVTALPHSGSGAIVTWAGTLGIGPALAVGQAPYSVAVVGTDVYIGDIGNAVIRDLDTLTGKESILAGDGGFGYSGDGGPATSAMISGVSAIVNCAGSTYFADTDNFVIRRIDSQGNISTVAGTGMPGYSGDGGPATSARIDIVLGLACRSAGGLYISDSGNGAVRILDGNGKIRTWWKGFSFPTGIAEMGANDVVAVSDAGLDNAVWALSDATIALMAGTPGVAGFADGAAGSALFDDPRGLTYNSGSGVFVADRGNHRVRQIQVGFVYTFAGTGTAGFTGDGGQSYNAELNQPTDVVMVGYDFMVVDAGNFRVRRIQQAGCCTITTVAGNGTPSLSGNGGPSINAQVGVPYAVAVDAAGNQYVAEAQNNVIRKIDTNGVISTVAGNGVAGYAGDGSAATGAELSDPRGVFVAGNGDLYISDTGNQVVRKVDHSSGNISTVAGNFVGGAGFSGDGGLATSALLSFPRAVVVNSLGDLFIADTVNNRVRKVDHTNGHISTVAGTGVAGYSGEGVATSVELNAPRGLAFDASGHLYIADSNNNRVRKVDLSTGVMSTVVGNGTAGPTGDGGQAALAELNFPFGLAFDPAGNLYIADTANQRIRVVGTDGVISSVVGICGIVAGLSGDWGSASTAKVNYPFGLGVDPSGDIFIADSSNNRVRIVYGLVGVRKASCQSPSGSPGSRGANQSTVAGTPSLRIEQSGSSLRTSGRTGAIFAPAAPRPYGVITQPQQSSPASRPAASAPKAPNSKPLTGRPGVKPGVIPGAGRRPAIPPAAETVTGIPSPSGSTAVAGLIALLILGALAVVFVNRRRRSANPNGR